MTLFHRAIGVPPKRACNNVPRHVLDGLGRRTPLAVAGPGKVAKTLRRLKRLHFRDLFPPG
jgi:hypothetical protein